MQPWLSPPPSGNAYVLTYHGIMPKLLSNDAIAAFKRDGFYSPLRVMSAADAQRYRKALEAHEAIAGKPLQGNWRHKTHLLFTWADELVHHPKILDAVEDLIGPNILCWTTNFFIKEAANPGFISWHQDSKPGLAARFHLLAPGLD